MREVERTMAVVVPAAEVAVVVVVVVVVVVIVVVVVVVVMVAVAVKRKLRTPREGCERRGASPGKRSTWLRLTLAR